jgi:hypothetical protein
MVSPKNQTFSKRLTSHLFIVRTIKIIVFSSADFEVIMCSYLTIKKLIRELFMCEHVMTEGTIEREIVKKDLPIVPGWIPEACSLKIFAIL